MLLTVFITNCHVSEKWKINPEISQPSTNSVAAAKAQGRPLPVAVLVANVVNQWSPSLLGTKCLPKIASRGSEYLRTREIKGSGYGRLPDNLGRVSRQSGPLSPPTEPAFFRLNAKALERPAPATCFVCRSLGPLWSDFVRRRCVHGTFSQRCCTA